MMQRLTLVVLFALWPWLPAVAAADASMVFVQEQIRAHAGKSGAYVLDTAEEALVARAWLVDHAQHSIEVQYFIWSTDNIGILAAEAILRAAQRGVRVRIVVDDLLVDVPDKSLLALARHPNIDIRIYNPTSSVGVPWHKRVWNLLTDFRGINQRMHDKTFIVDGQIAITGGRNMAAEYYDYHHEYNFRDRDALLVGDAVKSMRASFRRFWSSKLSVPVEDLYDGFGLLQKNVRVQDDEVELIYRGLHAYASSTANFAPEVHAAIEQAPTAFARLATQIIWGEVEFVSDRPGKNRNRFDMGGSGLTTAALARLVEGAQDHIVIQSPYLVLSDEALELFRRTRARDVRVRISTNSLASTDNLPAFGGYRGQREELLKMGLEIHEYRPDPQLQRQAMQRALVGQPQRAQRKPPVFGLHAKTLVVDSRVAFIGTFNLDPRSENLNTEVGAIIRNDALARAVEAAIETDMSPANSWNAATDDPDQYVSFSKRSKARFWQMMPIRPLL